VGSKSFLNFFQNSNGHIPEQSSKQTRVAMWKIFGSGRNMYVVEEPSSIHSTPINLKIKVQQDSMVTFEFFFARMRFCVYQDITTLISSVYQNRGYAQVVATNLKQRRMYNLTMSYGSSFY
jgi:hypothetical protein